MTLPDNIDAMLVRYFAGQLPEEERVALEAWIAEAPGRRDAVEGLRAVWAASAVRPADPDTDAALDRLWERVRSEPAGQLGEPARPNPVLVLTTRPAARPWRRIASSIAAALALLVGGNLIWRAVEQAHRRAEESAPRPRYATARGQRASLRLPDGTTVLLNTESVLEVSAAYGGRMREVYLRGEAYFEVAHDSTRPFRVHGGSATTEVLGTRFGVRARPEESAVQVLVAEGRVALSGQRADSGRRLVLGHGDLGRRASDGATSVVHDVQVERGLAWKDGGLFFEREPLPEVLAELGRWYDREFVLGDSTLASTRLTTSLHGESLDEALQVLEASLEVTCHIAGRTITIERREPAGRSHPQVTH
jgi:transmembrane sensor